MQSDTLL